MSCPPLRLRQSAWPLHSLMVLKQTPYIWVRTEDGGAGRLGQGKRVQQKENPALASLPSA